MTGKIVLVGRTADLVARSGKSLLNTRPASSEDIPALAELYAAAYQASSTPDDSNVTSPEEAREILTKLFHGEFGRLLPQASPVVADEDDDIVAAALVVEQRTGGGVPEDPYLFELFTHASHRRQGLAEQLVRSSAAALAEAGHERLSLRIPEDNSPALALYLTLDFSRWQEAAEEDEI
ncbi:MAG: GNAT family N-acetyltransferase [Micrococcales bacterium]|nr:GNAT family N-acetyltransferase [Micrococcales bacterium]